MNFIDLKDSLDRNSYPPYLRRTCRPRSRDYVDLREQAARESVPSVRVPASSQAENASIDREAEELEAIRLAEAAEEEAQRELRQAMDDAYEAERGAWDFLSND